MPAFQCSSSGLILNLVRFCLYLLLTQEREPRSQGVVLDGTAERPPYGDRG